MNILVIAQRVPFPPNKGEKIRTYHQIAWLCAQGHQVQVAVPTATVKDEADLQALSNKLGIPVHSARLAPGPVQMAKGLLGGVSLSQANFASAALRETVDGIINRGEVSCVLLSASSLLPYAEAALKRPGCRVLMDFMDLDSDKWLQYSQKANWPMRWIYAREARKVWALEQRAAQRCDACFFIAEAEIALFNARVPDRPIYSLGNGIDQAAFYPSQQGLRAECAADPVLFFVGAMDYTPNVDAVCWFVNEAWARVRAKHPQARFVIAGMNPSAAVQALAQQPGVEVTGFVEEILPYFHQADLFVAPFRLARGVQNKVLQAFACGLPTLTTPMGVEGIQCQAQTHYVPASTLDEFVTEITALAANTERRKALGAAASQLIQDHYSWEAQLAVLGQHLK
jgi:sugar transferase (PEP-CTERM/EpsH1 system associated)